MEVAATYTFEKEKIRTTVKLQKLDNLQSAMITLASKYAG